MSRPFGRLRSLFLVAAGALLVLAPLVTWRDYVSLERGNRLYRDGRFPGAIRLYRRHLPPDSANRSEAKVSEGAGSGVRGGGDGGGMGASAAVSYNLGTAWLALGSAAEAEANLSRARSAEDAEVRYRAHFNFGYLAYTEALGLSDRTMAAQLIGEAVLAFRDALRVRPEADDARWNLALAMLALDSVVRRDRSVLQGIPTRADPGGLETIDERLAQSGAGDPGELSPEEAGESLLAPGERQLGGGARETLAESGDSGARTPGQIAEVLAAIDDNVSSLLRRLLWLGGPRAGPGSPGGAARRAGEW